MYMCRCRYNIWPFTGVAVNVPRLQIVETVIHNVWFGIYCHCHRKVAPVQLPDFGVTVYVAVCTELVGLVSVPLMFAACPC